MGEVVSLDQRRRARVVGLDARAHAAHGAVALQPATTIWFDLAAPGTYFAAERADRMFPQLLWRPVLGGPPVTPQPAPVDEVTLRAATARAAELHMPLIWPEGRAAGGRAAMRVAAFASERGQASAFVLAASRLAFCGGFDIDDPEILAEAAAAAHLPLDECLRAAGDRSRDAGMQAAGRRLLAQGADRLPVLAIGRRLFCGEDRLAEAAAAVRAPCAEQRQGPLDESAG